MDELQPEALLLEALSARILRLGSPALWQALYLARERPAVRFETRQLVVVHAQPGLAGGAFAGAGERLSGLLMRHQGWLDPTVDRGLVVSCEDPWAAVRLARELLRLDGGPTRVAVAGGSCTLASFSLGGRLGHTPLGPLAERAERLVAQASPGGWVLAPEIRARVRTEFGPGTRPQCAQQATPSGWPEASPGGLQLAPPASQRLPGNAA